MKSYVVDDGARQMIKNSWPTPEEAIEKALESARKLQRAVSIWEWDPNRKRDWPQIPSARSHYCLVFPDGSTQKSTKGENPFKLVMDDSDSGSNPETESVEDQLGLPKLTLGSVVSQIDKTLHELHGKADKQVLARLDDLSNRITTIATVRVERSRNILTAFADKRGTILRLGGTPFIVTNVNQITGTVRLLGIDRSELHVDALTLARELARADQEAEAHHLAPGDVAMLNGNNRVFVLDSTEDSYVVLQDGNIQTVPDDLDRIQKAVDAGDPEAKQVRRIWQAFFRSLLRFFDVASVDELDSEQKSRMFDIARRKWQKTYNEMMEKEREGEEEEDTNPDAARLEQKAKEAPPEEKPAESGYEDEDDNWDYDEPTVDSGELLDEFGKMLNEFMASNVQNSEHYVWDASVSPNNDFEIHFEGDQAGLNNLKMQLEKSNLFDRFEMNGNELVGIVSVDLLNDIDNQLSEGWEDPGDPSAPYGLSPSIPGRKKFFGANWFNNKTLLSYFMHEFNKDIEAASKLALSMTTTDVTTLRSMRTMRKFEDHALSTNWFNVAQVLAEVDRRNVVKAGTVDLTPAKNVQRAAAKALEEAHRTGTVLPEVAARQAHTLASGKSLSLAEAERMHAFFRSRKTPKNHDLLWEAWGGNAGQRWVASVAQKISPVMVARK